MFNILADTLYTATRLDAMRQRKNRTWNPPTTWKGRFGDELPFQRQEDMRHD